MLDSPFDPDPVDLAFFRKWFGNADFDPTGGILTAGLALAGGAVSAAGTLAGGSYAASAGRMQQAQDQYQATQLRTNAGQALAASQRTMMETQQRGNLAISSSRAIAAASGVNAGAGSAVENVGELARRSAYLASMDLFNGKSQATALLSEANSAEYSGKIAALGGQEAQKASYLAAGGQMLGAVGSAVGKITLPTPVPSAMPAGYNPNSLSGLY
jgi:hypothetical protein